MVATTWMSNAPAAWRRSAAPRSASTRRPRLQRERHVADPSRKSVPPSASGSGRACLAPAPEKLPGRCPKSSLSIASGMAAVHGDEEGFAAARTGLRGWPWRYSRCGSPVGGCSPACPPAAPRAGSGDRAPGRRRTAAPAAEASPLLQRRSRRTANAQRRRHRMQEKSTRPLPRSVTARRSPVTERTKRPRSSKRAEKKSSNGSPSTLVPEARLRASAAPRGCGR